MNSSIFVVLSVLLAVAVNAQAAQIAVSDHSNKIAEYSETVAVVPEANSDMKLKGVTPYDYKSMMLRNIVNFACWQCSYPCNAYMCCNDGYPQCCLVSGRCMCCRY